MAISGIIGLALSLALLVWGIVISAHITWFVDVYTGLTVIGGALAVAMTRYGLADVLAALAVALSALVRRKPEAAAAIDELAGYVIEAQRNGPAELTRFAREVKDAFTEEGLALVARGIEPQRIESEMMASVVAVARTHRQARDILRFMMISVILIGGMWVALACIMMLQNMDDPASIGPAVAVALLSIAYGFVVGAVLLWPLAGRVGDYGLARQAVMLIQLEGFKALARGDGLDAMKMRLAALAAQVELDRRVAGAWARLDVRMEDRRPDEAPVLSGGPSCAAGA